ncbi:hypothetical protein N658DRAFT_424416 [Parathielavia hyrcaniae]|uniref:Uncharacterized protein n=1 Tax=Parathielavia hyrcaniae TaxID=113614 RepID=A0AAN6Q1P3_9PEZI|nr:hypothetical protein N658DRAFT_424416 [Parathielavia hyrcaniae]
MVYTTDEALFDEAWSRLKSQFSDQEAIIAYLEERFLRRKEEWAGPWISRNANFGQRTTSPTESSQKELKGYLIHGRSNLYKLMEVVMEMLDLKKAAFEQKVADQKLRLRHQYLGPGFAWSGNTNREVARKAIDKFNVQRRWTR